MFEDRHKESMDSPAHKLKLRFDVLPKNTEKALDFSSAQEWLIKTDWYLGFLSVSVGGSQLPSYPEGHDLF